MELDNRLQKAGSDAVKKEDDHRKVVAALQTQLANAAAAGAAGAAAAAAAQAGQQPAPAAAAALANGGPLPAAAAAATAADGSVLGSMRKQAAGLMQNIQSQAPGYARMLQDTLMGGPQGNPAAAMGGPEHVPQPVGARGSMSGMQETELERKTRELQVRRCKLLGPCGTLSQDFTGASGSQLEKTC